MGRLREKLDDDLPELTGGLVSMIDRDGRGQTPRQPHADSAFQRQNNAELNRPWNISDVRIEKLAAWASRAEPFADGDVEE
jgi:hypothetical protein